MQSWPLCQQLKVAAMIKVTDQENAIYMRHVTFFQIDKNLAKVEHYILQKMLLFDMLECTSFVTFDSPA